MTSAANRIDGVEVFEPPPSRRSFSPVDVVRLALGLVLIAGGALVIEVAASTVEGFESDVLRAFARLPDQLEDVLLRAAQFVTSFVPLVALVVLLFRRRWKVALLLLLTSGLATVAMQFADGLVVDRDLTAFLDELAAETDQQANEFPQSPVIASSIAVVVVAQPWLSRRWKRTLWWSIAVLVFLRVVAVADPALDLLLAVGVGLTVGSAVLLLFGSPTSEPDPAELLAALRADGFDPVRIDRADTRADGALRFAFEESGGGRHVLLLRTPDERDADLLSRFYRSLRFRASEVDRTYSSLQRRLEHEALVLSLADQAGVRTRRIDRIGATERGSVYLVMHDPDTRPVQGADLARTELLADVWSQVGALHDAGMAHRALTLEALRVDGEGAVWFGHFDGARIAPAEREVARDVAELLVETALEVGAPEAVRAAVAALGPSRVSPAMRMLQPLALPPTTRGRLGDAEEPVLEQLRDEVHGQTGEPAVALEAIERIKPRTVLIVAASALAFYSLLPQFANFEDTLDAFGDARVPWIVAAVAASALTYVFATISFQGAVADPVPFAPAFRAQVASSFAGLVGPAGAGGFALTARFLERVGVRAGEAGASVAVNAVAGFAVHLSLMAGAIVLAGGVGVDGFSVPDSSTLLLVVAVVLGIVGVALAIGPVRRRVLGPLRRTVGDGISQVARVFRSPARVAALFGGSLGISLAYVTAVWLCVEAFGGGATYAQIGAAYLVAVAIATFAPTPGGLGALESAMIAGLTGFGVADGVAVSATLTFRLATFWLPVLPGWIAFGWMQRHGEL